jgi:hypothetical protein
MLQHLKHWRPRDLRFLGLVGLTALVGMLYLSEGLRLAAREGSGWRTLDLDVLMQRIETGELRDREADWYHPASDEEERGVRRMK